MRKWHVDNEWYLLDSEMNHPIKITTASDWARLHGQRKLLYTGDLTHANTIPMYDVIHPNDAHLVTYNHHDSHSPHSSHPTCNPNMRSTLLNTHIYIFHWLKNTFSPFYWRSHIPRCMPSLLTSPQIQRAIRGLSSTKSFKCTQRNPLFP